MKKPIVAMAVAGLLLVCGTAGAGDEHRGYIGVQLKAVEYRAPAGEGESSKVYAEGNVEIVLPEDKEKLHYHLQQLNEKKDD